MKVVFAARAGPAVLASVSGHSRNRQAADRQAAEPSEWIPFFPYRRSE